MDALWKVTWCSGSGRLTVGSRRLLGPRLAQPQGSQLKPWRCLMATTTSSAALVPTASLFTDAERLALAGFLAGYKRPDPPGLRAGPAPVRQLVPAPAAA